MNRRNFVRNTAVGAISLSVSPPQIFGSSLVFQSGAMSRALQQLGRALSGRRRSAARLAPENFAQLTGVTDQYFAQRGYKGGNETIYFFGEREDWCFYPLFLHHRVFDHPPMVVPVFHYGEDGWYLVIVLDGFEIEAICRASLALKDRDAAVLQDLLIPTGKAGPYVGSTAYKTREGMVAVKTVHRGGKAQTTCTIVGRDEKVFSETFDSKHCRLA